MIYAPIEQQHASYKWHQSKGIEFTPESIVKHSRNKNHPLHAHFWQRSKDEWADVGRYEGARRIVQTVMTEISIGGKRFVTRAVEFVHTREGGQYADISEIIESNELQLGYMMEIERNLIACTEKMQKLREMMAARESEAKLKKAS